MAESALPPVTFGVKVIRDEYALIKVGGWWPSWASTTGHQWDNDGVDLLLAEGAPVLRHGYGEES